MRKVSIIILFFIGFYNFAHSAPAIDIVKDFGESLENWCKTKDSKYQIHIESLVANQKVDGKDCRISDRIINENSPEDIRKDINVYTMIFKSHIHDGLSVNYSNIKLDHAPEFSTPVFGQSSDSPVCVSCDIHVEGALNYDTKDIFYIRSGKIVAIGDYYADMTFNNAFLLLKQKRYQDALDIFEEIYHARSDIGQSLNARDFVLSILLKRSKKLSYGKYARMYKISHIVDKYYLGKTQNLPLLDADNYDIALRSSKEFKRRIAYFPSGLDKAIPYSESVNGDWNIGCYYRHVFRNYRDVPKKRFTIYKDGMYGFADEYDNIIIPPQYQFAYPFDEKVGLALVKHFNGGWGYVDMQGRARTNQNYASGSDVWYNNKTFVRSSSDEVLLIDNYGNIVKQLNYFGFSHAHPCSTHGEEILMMGNDESSAIVDFDGNVIRDKNSLKYRHKDYSLEKELSSSMYEAYILCSGCTLNIK